MEIAGIPQSISRSRYQELIRSLGLEVDRLASLRFEWNAVIAEQYALNEQDHRYTSSRGKAAIHRIAIPVVDDETAE